MITHDITEVAAEPGTTSRALRYYESEGLIESTTDGYSRRRRYTDAQIDTVKQVLILHAPGLPIAAVRDLRASRVSLEDAILSRRADVLRLIGEKQAEINLLEEALYRIRVEAAPTGASVTDGASPVAGASLAVPISQGGDRMTVTVSDSQRTVADTCTDALPAGHFAACVAHFSADMQVLLGVEAPGLSWSMACAPPGDYRDRAVTVQNRSFTVTRLMAFRRIGRVLGWTSALALCLAGCTACEVEVHWLEHSAMVPWYVVAIPVTLFSILIMLLAHLSLLRGRYQCSECRTVIRPRWNEISVRLHVNDCGVVKCPHCGRRGFCRRVR